MKDLTKLKFKENGDFNYFPGNTVVANLYTKPELMEVIDIVQSRHLELPFIDKFTLTPRGSIHMTVIELLCHENREPEFWSSHLALDTPLQEIHDYFAKELDIFPLLNEEIRMRVVGMGRQNILVEPADEASAKRLEEIRTYVSEKAGVRFPNHDTYQFHISIGYLRIPLTEEEEAEFTKVRAELTEILLEKIPVITVNRIDYTVFEDMRQFVPYHEKN
ncbi:DUF1868 domain-containing protein [Streptococcus oralis]|uniref:DUF1868 domain-containing protein n=1 Tax=Streptococcus oralis TaxID=1303 RepID=A0A139QR35_STROR|nr:DUF1868 domain-containing protein [Streptococcus oralis]KXU04977.1 hypothetical protein SORDD24_00978 [Streptococcus oralis]